MQQANVELPGHRRWIAIGDIFGHRAVWERTAMKRYTELVQRERLGHSRRKLAYIWRQCELSRDDGFGVVVPAYDETWSAKP
jgi:hypothetical protein